MTYQRCVQIDGLDKSGGDAIIRICSDGEQVCFYSNDKLIFSILYNDRMWYDIYYQFRELAPKEQ